MKQKQHALHSSIPSVRLFYEDINSIIKIITDSCERIEISDGEYEFESIEELMRERGNNLKQLYISGHNPYISISFERGCSRTRLFASSENIVAEANFFKIRELLLQRKMWLNHVFNPVTGFVAFLSLIILSTELVISMFPSLLLWVSFYLLAILIPVFSFLFSCNFFNSISLNKAHESRPFWIRNKDAIILLIISVIIGGIVTWIVTNLFAK